MKLFKNNVVPYASAEGDKIYPIVVDIKKGIKSGEAISFVTADNQVGVITIDFMDGNSSYSIEGCMVTSTIHRPDGTVLEIPCDIISQSTIEIPLGVNGTYQEGVHTFDLKIFRDNGKIIGVPTMNYIVHESLSSDDYIEEEDKLPIIAQLTNQVIHLKNEWDIFTDRFGDMSGDIIQGVGTTPNILVGNVETLPEGSTAYITRRGTNEEPIFDFGIPRGYKGEQGIQGPKGEQGLAGPSYNDTELRELISALTKRIEKLEKGNIPPIEGDEGVTIEGSYCGQMAFKPADTITIEDLERLANRVDVTRPQTIYAHSGDTVYNKTVICAIPKTQWNIKNVIDGAGVDITASYPITEKEINGTIYMISCNKVAQAYNKSTVVKFNIN